jgi:hypothetical protein
MTTATAPDLDKLNTTVDHVAGAVGSVGEVAMNFSSPVLRAMFGPVASAGMFEPLNTVKPVLKNAYDSVAETTTKMLNEASNIAIRDHISKMEPNEVLDFAAKEIPDLKEIAEIGKTDPAFASAFKEMLVKDGQALNDIKATLEEEGSGATLIVLKELIKNDQTRAELTLKMNKVADSENYGFADMKNELLGTVGANSISDFFKDIFANPNMFLSKMETLLGPDNFFVNAIKPVLAVIHGLGSMMREGMSEYAQLGPSIVRGSEEYLAKQGNTWSTYTPGF